MFMGPLDSGSAENAPSLCTLDSLRVVEDPIAYLLRNFSKITLHGEHFNAKSVNHVPSKPCPRLSLHSSSVLLVESPPM